MKLKYSDMTLEQCYNSGLIYEYIYVMQITKV